MIVAWALIQGLTGPGSSGPCDLADELGMNVASASYMQQAQVMSQVQTSVAAKTLDAAKQQGDAAVSLLEDAAQLQQQMQPANGGAHVGQMIDVVA